MPVLTKQLHHQHLPIANIIPNPNPKNRLPLAPVFSHPPVPFPAGGSGIVFPQFAGIVAPLNCKSRTCPAESFSHSFPRTVIILDSSVHGAPHSDATGCILYACGVAVTLRVRWSIHFFVIFVSCQLHLEALMG